MKLFLEIALSEFPYLKLLLGHIPEKYLCLYINLKITIESI